MKYNAVIVGAGSIGALKDDEFDRPGGANILTHAHAIWDNSNIYLIGIVDHDIQKAIQAGKKWGCASYQHIDYIKDKIDIIVIACNTEFHAVYFDVARYFRTKTIIIEKPVGINSREAKAFEYLSTENNINIHVGYIRNYCKEIVDVMSNLISGKYGKIYCATVKYNRGLYRDGCHAIQLLVSAFGRPNRSYRVNVNESYNDYSDQDKTGAVYLSFAKCPHVIMLPVDGRELSIFEIEFTTESGTIRMLNNGNIIQHNLSGKDNPYGKYKSMTKTCEHTETSLMQSLSVLYEQVVNELSGMPVEMKSTLHSAIITHEVMESLCLQ